MEVDLCLYYAIKQNRYEQKARDRNPPRTYDRPGGVHAIVTQPKSTTGSGGGGGGARDRNPPRTYDRRGPPFDNHCTRYFKKGTCLVERAKGRGLSCTKTCVDFLLKLGVSTNQFRCIKVCVRMDPRTFLLHIPINVELSAHAEVANSSLSTPSFKYANLCK